LDEEGGCNCSDAEEDECDDEPGSDRMEMMAALPDGIMHASPTSARYPFGCCEYTCFQIIQPPNPIRTTSRKF
jgi:hypothetical protein